MSVQLQYQAGSVEFVRAEVTADVALDAQPVFISIDSGATWLDAQWEGAVGTTRLARTAEVVTFTPRPKRQVLVRITDLPEAPVIPAGEIVVRTP